MLLQFGPVVACLRFHQFARIVAFFGQLVRLTMLRVGLMRKAALAVMTPVGQYAHILNRIEEIR